MSNSFNINYSVISSVKDPSHTYFHPGVQHTLSAYLSWIEMITVSSKSYGTFKYICQQNLIVKIISVTVVLDHNFAPNKMSY